MVTKREILRWGEEQLRKSQIADWKTDSWLLLEFVTGISRARFLLDAMEEMPEEKSRLYHSLIEQRCCHVPVQHIIGKQDFMGYSFVVNPHVLIPRMETELLVLEVEKHLEGVKEVLDLCTGSGCIALSLKKRNPHIALTGTDISQEALEVAKKNCELLEISVDFYLSDLFAYFYNIERNRQGITSDIDNKYWKFDIIVSNPPYIPRRVIDGLAEEVRCHEPLLALDGAEDGLEFYRRITKESRNFLKESGMLFYEIGHNQAEDVCQIMEAEGFCNVNVVQDLAGHDRVVYGGMKHV